MGCPLEGEMSDDVKVTRVPSKPCRGYVIRKPEFVFVLPVRKGYLRPTPEGMPYRGVSKERTASDVIKDSYRAPKVNGPRAKYLEGHWIVRCRHDVDERECKACSGGLPDPVLTF